MHKEPSKQRRQVRVSTSLSLVTCLFSVSPSRSVLAPTHHGENSTSVVLELRVEFLNTHKRAKGQVESQGDESTLSHPPAVSRTVRKQHARTHVFELSLECTFAASTCAGRITALHLQRRQQQSNRHNVNTRVRATFAQSKAT